MTESLSLEWVSLYLVRWPLYWDRSLLGAWFTFYRPHVMCSNSHLVVFTHHPSPPVKHQVVHKQVRTLGTEINTVTPCHASNRISMGKIYLIIPYANDRLLNLKNWVIFFKFELISKVYYQCNILVWNWSNIMNLCISSWLGLIVLWKCSHIYSAVLL